eukprot:TRINITY_DN4369_c0_g3_i2.p1 TRINITY_DN4369_c0_g3~~TRINITY_DN4369_c0_g3_i2.p1  ORF type:complete len:301 (-),score=74.63 TRINITY_DN4369_c0_g3_i2:365-1267(-)
MDNARKAIRSCHKLVYETESTCKHIEETELSITKKGKLSARESQARKAVAVNSYLVKKPDLAKQLYKEDMSSSLNSLHKHSELSKINLTDELSPSSLEQNLPTLQSILSISAPILGELARKLARYEARLPKLEERAGPASQLAGTLPSGKIDEMKRGKQFKVAPKGSSEWIMNVNIGNVMHLMGLSVEDLAIFPQVAHEMCRDALYEKIIMTSIAYFSIATECRFLCGEGGDEVYQSESKYWHRAAVELVCTFLPNECPLVAHIISSYEKHNTLAQEVIVLRRVTLGRKLGQGGGGQCGN